MTQPLQKALAIALTTALLSSGAQAKALADLYEKARQNDPQLKSATAESLAGQQVAPLKRAALLPQVSLTGSRTETNNAVTNSGVVDAKRSGGQLSLSQPLFDLSSWYDYQSGKLTSEAAKLGLEAAEQGLINRTVNAYLNVLRAQATLEVALSRERALSRRLDQVNAQFDVGLIAITDVLEAKASYDDARVSLIDAEGNLQNSYEELERLSGETGLEVMPVSADYPIDGLDEKDIDAWVDKALNGNIALRLAKTTEMAARKSAQAATSGHLPTLALNMNTISGNKSYESYDNQVTLNLTIPIFTGGATTASQRQAQYTAQQKMYDTEDTTRQVIQETRSLLRDIETGVASVAARMKSIESRETALEATSQGFEVGTRNVVDVLDAEKSLYEARQAYADARISYISNLFQLKLQVGQLSPEDLFALDNWLQP